MKQMKYIVMDNGSWIAPYIFSEAVQHFEMAGYLSGRVISAGFVSFTSSGLECYGESISLEIKSHPEEDSKMINKMLGVPK